MMNKEYAEPGLDRKKLLHLFVPQLNRRTFFRWGIAAVLILIFAVLVKPCFISGSSMEPGYRDRSVLLIFRWRYTFVPPNRKDVVSIDYFGRRNLLKRVVALPGDTVEFRNGALLINGIIQQEEYVKKTCSWNFPAVIVREGHCFVVGDNRSQDIGTHVFGEVELDRINGGPLW